MLPFNFKKLIHSWRTSLEALLMSFFVAYCFGGANLSQLDGDFIGVRSLYSTPASTSEEPPTVDSIILNSFEKLAPVISIHGAIKNEEFFHQSTILEESLIELLKSTKAQSSLEYDSLVKKIQSYPPIKLNIPGITWDEEENKPSFGGETPEFNSQVEMNQSLNGRYALNANEHERVAAARVDPTRGDLLTMLEEKFSTLMATPGLSEIEREALKRKKDELLSNLRNPYSSDPRLRAIFRLLTSWIAALKEEKGDYHRVHLARDGGFFHLVDEQLEGKDAGSSVYHLSRPRMSGEPSQKAYNKMSNIISQAQLDFPTNINELFVGVRKRFRDVYAADSSFRHMVDEIAKELGELGYMDQKKIMFVDTGFMGSIPFFLKNVVDLKREERGDLILDGTGEELVQIAVVQPSSISGFARALFGFDLNLFSEEEKGLIEALAKDPKLLGSLGAHLEEIRAHPIQFDERSWTITETSAATQLEVHYEKILASTAVADYRDRVEEVERQTEGMPESARRAALAAFAKEDFGSYIQTMENFDSISEAFPSLIQKMSISEPLFDTSETLKKIFINFTNEFNEIPELKTPDFSKLFTSSSFGAEITPPTTIPEVPEIDLLLNQKLFKDGTNGGSGSFFSEKFFTPKDSVIKLEKFEKIDWGSLYPKEELKIDPKAFDALTKEFIFLLETNGINLDQNTLPVLFDQRVSIEGKRAHFFRMLKQGWLKWTFGVFKRRMKIDAWAKQKKQWEFSVALQQLFLSLEERDPIVQDKKMDMALARLKVLAPEFQFGGLTGRLEVGVRQRESIGTLRLAIVNFLQMEMKRLPNVLVLPQKIPFGENDALFKKAS